MAEDTRTPLLEHDPEEPPVFLPGNLLEAARLQKGLPRGTVPSGCLLDFDGELVEHLVATGRAEPEPSWPCYHTKLFRWRREDAEYGIIGGTVGAPYAVLVAEELFAAGCEALVSISSAGLIAENLAPPFFLLIERALRDEGTSHHYLPTERFAASDPGLIAFVERRLAGFPAPVRKGTSWTTDAPFRETERLIASRRSEGIVSVEMEAAALLSMGEALKRPVLCLAHVTNAMATRPEDFEKGGDQGQETALLLCSRVLDAALEYLEITGPRP
ncbi:MAG: nucleoside phosphorylase [Deltaproteobacteria bacterium]|nr:nucleoside phosphorylase [Deltaproteobacteria bacterium]